MKTEFYHDYVGHTLATIAKERTRKAKQAFYDLGDTCGSVTPGLDAECLFLMAWSMNIEGRDDLIPYLVDRGVGCGETTCLATGQVISAGTGLLSPQSGVTPPLAGTDGVAGTPGTGGATPGGGGSSITPTSEQVDRWNQAAVMARVPKPLEYIVGQDLDGPIALQDTFEHADMQNWHISLYINRIPQTQKAWDGTYYTKPAASRIITLTGMKWQQGDLVQIVFESYEIPIAQFTGIITEDTEMQVILEGGEFEGQKLSS